VVREYVLASEGAVEFVEQYARVLEFALARYTAQDKPFVTVSIGCTGGKHRSVAIAEALGQRLESMGVMVRVTHRDREHA